MGAAPDEPEEPRYNACSAALTHPKAGTRRAPASRRGSGESGRRSGSPTIEQIEPSAGANVDHDNEPRAASFASPAAGGAGAAAIDAGSARHRRGGDAEKEGCVVESRARARRRRGSALDGAVVRAWRSRPPMTISARRRRRRRQRRRCRLIRSGGAMRRRMRRWRGRRRGGGGGGGGALWRGGGGG